MKNLVWSESKNALLKRESGISFEEIQFALENDKLLDIRVHPNKRKYPNQQLYYIEMNEYVCVVPCLETENEIVLKTAFFSRTATKKYLGGNKR